MSTAPRRPAHRVPSDGAVPAVALDWPVAIGTAARRACCATTNHWAC
mgnify:CR=1 FL=1